MARPFRLRSLLKPQTSLIIVVKIASAGLLLVGQAESRQIFPLSPSTFSQQASTPDLRTVDFPPAVPNGLDVKKTVFLC